MLSLNDLNETLLCLMPTRQYLVAYSGGVDSTALLHALWRLRQLHPDIQLRAVHVNHGLHADAKLWQQHCEQYCLALNIPLISLTVDLQIQSGDSVEAVARGARYRAFAETLTNKELLLTAHHCDDQAETFLLQLIRGAGVSGLSAMPMKRQFAQGHHLRPLLKYSRADIEAYVQTEQLRYLQDPSNSEARFDRNYIRQTIMPKLQQRFPSISQRIARSTRHCAETKTLIAELAAQDLQLLATSTPHCINIAVLKNFSVHRQKNVLRYWFAVLQVRSPSAAQLDRIIADFLLSRYDASPYFSWDGVELRRYQHALYLLPTLKFPQQNWQQVWYLTAPLTTPVGELIVQPVKGAGINMAKISAPVTVRFRCGGEILDLPGRGRHSLKHCLQEWQVPPWQRQRIPLLFHENELIAVVGFAVAANYATPPTEMGWLVQCQQGERYDQPLCELSVP